MTTLQKQGVPVPDKLNGPGNGPQIRRTATHKTNRGSAPRRSAGTSSKSVSNRQSRNSAMPNSMSGPSVNPVSAGTDIADGVGLLEAEFLAALGLLVLLMFSSDADLVDKMMSVMKRGTLVCAVFFILAIVSSIGHRTAMAAKAMGALVIVAILVKSDMGTVITDLDNIVKNDWIGTPATPASASGSADKATASTGGSGGSFSAAERAALASIGDADSLGKLLNPADEAKGTLDTVKAIGDTLAGLGKKFLGL